MNTVEAITFILLILLFPITAVTVGILFLTKYPTTCKKHRYNPAKPVKQGDHTNADN